MNRFYPARGARNCKKPRNNNKITGNKKNQTSTALIHFSTRTATSKSILLTEENRNSLEKNYSIKIFSRPS